MTETYPPLTTSTNLGPMTTPMSFPSDCLSSLYDFNTLGLGIPYTYQTQGCALSTCCPYENYYTEDFAWLTSYYSPGVCPIAYKKCPVPTKFASLSRSSGEIIAFCCPYDYQCWSDTNGACGSLMSSPTSVVVVDNIYDQSVISTRAWTLPQSMETAGKKQWQIAYPFQIRWKDADLVPKTDVSTTAEGEGSPWRTSNSLVPTSSGTSSAASPSSSTLSTGAIVGIVTGTISAVATSLGLAFKVYKWRHKKKHPEGSVMTAEPKTTANP